MTGATARPALTIALLVVFALPMAAEVVTTSDQLAARFAEQGLVPLPSHDSILIEGGVVGVIEGRPSENEAKPYVLVVSGPPASRAALLGVTGAGTVHGRDLPPLRESIERHVIVAYLDDPMAHDALPLERVAASLDLSRADDIRGDCLLLRATGSSPVWPRLIEQTNIPLGLCLELEDAPSLGTAGAAAIFGAAIPGLQIETSPTGGAPDEGGYVGHVPATFARLLAAKLSRLDEPPSFVRVEKRPGTETESARPYTGTIPDYASDIEGLLLGGVLPGGPAEEAGLQEGDVIVELGGVEITDVYAYAKALDELAVDVPVSVIFVRGGERRETTLTPTARK